ncbi:uncharacterized protein LOC110464341 [Mizuhopecten yessoensis]|uniref:uncharacterized protein LOC110464341 n=1 Tax=Mizuhopecten yessoensis TaxID=6573 RepID=UPI000B45859C|nr:uncharacterized protein LOC110464341 [Mizuhopecten yessoensis]XP_021375196.1 uncharacterized protein LOC110464341 [Mizuhopecten yessoensis]
MGSSSSFLPSSVQYTTCDSCKADFQRAETFCLDCHEFYCPGCSSLHKSRDHRQVPLPPDTAPNQSDDKNTCDRCEKTDTVTVCLMCREVLCTSCCHQHKNTRFKEVHNMFDFLTQSEVDISDLDSKHLLISDTSEIPPLKALFERDFSSRVPGDRKNRLIEIQRIVTLPDDRVVVLDKENKKVKLFDADLNLKHYSNVDEDPVGLTVIDKSTLAVSDKKTNCITLYTVHNNTLQRYKSVSFDKEGWDLYDISYKNQHFLCLSCNESGQKSGIDMVDMAGHRNMIVEEDGNYDLGSHVVAGNRRCFYVSDYYKDQVRCITYAGEQLWTVATPTGPRGLTLVREKLCVVSVVEGMVLQTSMDGNMSDQLLVQGLVHPRCICFQEQRNTFLVAHDQADALIKMYKIE